MQNPSDGRPLAEERELGHERGRRGCDAASRRLLRPVGREAHGAGAARGTGTGEGAAQKADLDPESTECAIAARYLVDQKFIEARGDTSEYVITVAGFDKVREMRGMGAPAPPAGRNAMSDKAQQRLLTLLSIGISIGLSQPLTRFIGEKIPERRGIRDDVTEAVLQGLVRAVALTLASVIVRQIAASRR